jgi:cytochrome c551/c552
MRLLIFLFFLVAACVAAPPRPTLAPLLIGDAARGKILYERPVLGGNAAPGCITCHSLAPRVLLVGPSLNDIGSRAEVFVVSAAYTGRAKTPADYLHEAIVQPDAYVAIGFKPGVMYQKFNDDLTPHEIADLVAYLLTLR